MLCIIHYDVLFIEQRQVIHLFFVCQQRRELHYLPHGTVSR